MALGYINSKQTGTGLVVPLCEMGPLPFSKGPLRWKGTSHDEAETRDVQCSLVLSRLSAIGLEAVKLEDI